VCEFDSYFKQTIHLSAKGDWYFAKHDCTSKGMELVSIESLEEHQAIVDEISWRLFLRVEHS
jgi:hypothetical protein